jgi:hypothetical protein
MSQIQVLGELDNALVTIHPAQLDCSIVWALVGLHLQPLTFDRSSPRYANHTDLAIQLSWRRIAP